MADGHPLQLMPIRSIIIWAVGCLLFGYYFSTAHAQVPSGLPADAEPVATVRVDLNNCCWNSSKVIDQPSDGSWLKTDLIAGPSLDGCYALGVSQCRVHPSDPGISQALETQGSPSWQNSQVTFKCLNGSSASVSGPYLYCAAGNGWTPPPDCAFRAGSSFMCNVNTDTAYAALPSSGCQAQCVASVAPVANSRGVSVLGLGGKYWQKYTWTDEVCDTVSFCDNPTNSPGPDEAGVPPGGTHDLGDGQGEISDDGSEGSYPGGEFNEPPPGGCSYSDDGVWSCDDESGPGDGDGSVGTDGTGDGGLDDEYSFGTNWEDVPPGTTIVDPDTGETLGTAEDQDGDGLTDGIDTDGDGDIDVDDPTEPGGGQDNNGDGVVNDSDGDGDGDGKKGQAGDCVDDPDTEENECGGTDGEPGEGTVAGLSCDEEPSCQPAKGDIQGQLWCAQLKLQHKVSCQYHAPGADESEESLFANKPEDDGSELFEEINLEEEGPGLSTSVIAAGGACFTDIPFDVLGASFNVPLSALCPYFGAAGYMILLVGYMVAGMIVYRGMFG